MRKNFRNTNETCMLIDWVRSRDKWQRSPNRDASFIRTTDILTHYFILRLTVYPLNIRNSGSSWAHLQGWKRWVFHLLHSDKHSRLLFPLSLRCAPSFVCETCGDNGENISNILIFFCTICLKKFSQLCRAGGYFYHEHKTMKYLGLSRWFEFKCFSKLAQCCLPKKNLNRESV